MNIALISISVSMELQWTALGDELKNLASIHLADKNVDLALLTRIIRRLCCYW